VFLPYGTQGAGLLGCGLQVIFLFLVATSMPLFAEIWMERRIGSAGLLWFLAAVGWQRLHA
jgi:hypothetical protein